LKNNQRTVWFSVLGYFTCMTQICSRPWVVPRVLESYFQN